MKFIFDGGWDVNSESSMKNNLFFRYTPFLSEEMKNGKKLLIVTNAKPTSHYNDSIEPLLSLGTVVVDRDTKDNIDWGTYDCILVPGGYTTILFNELLRLGFDISKLKKDVLYIGSSAGSMIMSDYFYDYDRENKKVNFYRGLLPSNKELYVVHADNERYADEHLKIELKKLAAENNLQLVDINENETIERNK